MLSQQNKLTKVALGVAVTGIAVVAIVYLYQQENNTSRDAAKKHKAAQLARQKTLAVPLALFKACKEGNLAAVVAELSKEQVNVNEQVNLLPGTT